MTLGNEDVTLEVSEIVRDTVSHISLDGSGNVGFNGNNLEAVEKTNFNTSGNDFWKITDGSNGSNSSPFTARFDNRDLRFYAGDNGVGTVFEARLDGEIQFPSGDVTDGANVIYDQTESHVPSSRVQTAGLDADTVDGFEADELRTSSNVLQLSSTNTTLDINQNSWTDIPFDVQQILDGAFSHDASSSPETITFDEAGRYRVNVSLAFDGNGATRVNPGIKFNLNGTRLDTQALSGYIRGSSGHDEGSNTVSRVIDVSAGDTLEVQTIEQGDTGTVTLRANESVLTIEQLSASAALVSDAETLDGLDSTAFVKTDGSTVISSTQAINQGNNADYLRLNNSATGDQWDFSIDSNNNFEFDLNNNTVFEVNNSSRSVVFTQRVFGQNGFDAGGSSIDNSTEVNTPGGGSDSFDVYDSANGQDIAQFNEGGTVDIPNGDLHLTGGDIYGDEYLKVETGGNGSGEFVILDGNATQNIARFYEGGNVEIPNGSLSVSDAAGSSFVAESGDTMYGPLDVNGQINASNIVVGSNPKGSTEDIFLAANSNVSSDSSLYNLIDNGSDGEWAVGFGSTVRDGTETLSLLADASGTVRIDNGELELRNQEAIRFTGITGSAGLKQGTYTDPNSGVSMGEYEYGFETRSPGEPWQSSLGFIIGSDGNYRFYNSTGTRSFELGSDNTVEVPNGPLIMGGNYVRNATAISGLNGTGQRVNFSANGNIIVRTNDGTTETKAIEATVGGNVEIPNGQTLLQDGSASSPALSFADDTNTGIYRNAEDDLRITSSGTDAFRVDNGANILDVYGKRITNVGGTTDATSGAIRLANDSDIRWRNSGDTGDHTIRADNNDNFRFYNSGTPTFSIFSSGNVDIPNGDLSIDGSLSLSSSTIFGVNDIRLDQSILIQDGYGKIETGGSGSGEFEIRDGNVGQEIANFNEGGNVEIPNGDLQMNGNSVTTNNFEVTENSLTNSLDFNYTGA